MTETTYLPKVVRARLQTAGKTVEQYREEFKGQGYTYKQFQCMQRSDSYFNGLELWLTLWNYDNYESWHLWNWKTEDDEKVMLALFEAEQFHPYADTRFKNNFEQFKIEWEAGTYDPGCTFTFPLAAVEVLEIVQEEKNDIDQRQVKKAVAYAAEIRQRQNRRKRKATKRKFQYKKKS